MTKPAKQSEPVSFDKLPFPRDAPGFHTYKGVPYFQFESCCQDDLKNSNNWTPEERAICAAVATSWFDLKYWNDRKTEEKTLNKIQIWRNAFRKSLAVIASAKRAEKKGAK